MRAALWSAVRPRTAFGGLSTINSAPFVPKATRGRVALQSYRKRNLRLPEANELTTRPAVFALVVETVNLSQTFLKRPEVISVVYRPFRFLVNGPLFFRKARAVPGVKHTGGNRGKVRMTHRKTLAVFQRITDHSAPRIQKMNCGCFAGIQILAAYFLQGNLFAEIHFVERHEVRVNVPFVRIALVHPMKDRASQTMMGVEPVYR